MAAGVLNAEEFSILSFYMRPLAMHPPQDPLKWVKLPAAIDVYRKDKSLIERQDIAYIAAIKIKCTEEYKNSSIIHDKYSLGQFERRQGKSILPEIIRDLSTLASENTISVGAQMMKDAKKVFVPKQEDGPKEQTSEKSGTVGKNESTTGPTPAAPEIVAPVAVSAPSPNSTLEFNAVASVVAEEMKHIKPGTIKGTLLTFFSDVAGISAPVLRILSQTTLRKESLSQQEAAKPLTDMGLQFADVVNMVNGAVLKIRAHAEGDEEYQFVLDALKNYRFE